MPGPRGPERRREVVVLDNEDAATRMAQATRAASESLSSTDGVAVRS